MTARALLVAIACSALLSCTDPGVVGVAEAEREPCGGCPAGERCLVAQDRCVQCEQDTDCVTADLPPYCVAFECVACRAGEPCEPQPPQPEPDCEDDLCPCPDGGACVRCEENSDCDGPGDQSCEDGFCVIEEES